MTELRNKTPNIYAEAKFSLPKISLKSAVEQCIKARLHDATMTTIVASSNMLHWSL